jgi:hypothetical protein
VEAGLTGRIQSAPLPCAEYQITFSMPVPQQHNDYVYLSPPLEHVTAMETLKE